MRSDGMTQVAERLLHVAQVSVDPFGEPMGFRAVCSCGWDSELCADEAAATNDLNDHLEVAVGPATGVDLVVSELWDLADDVVEVIGWLADRWPADMPTPQWYSNGFQGKPRPAVTVQATCTAAEVARAAELLGVTPIQDTEPGVTRPIRFLRAVRDFGMVRIDAHHRLDPEGVAA